jgi:hypothetical protein
LYFANQKLIKATFKGNEVVYMQESEGWVNSHKVTVMTIVGDILLIGYLDGTA